MQTVQHITRDQLHQLVAAVFDQGPVVVQQAYSDFGCATKGFPNANALLDDLHFKPTASDSFRQYTLYYPEAKGHAHERRIDLKPEACQGHTFRFCQEGWGLIQLQCDFRRSPIIECRIAVNSATPGRDLERYLSGVSKSGSLGLDGYKAEGRAAGAPAAEAGKDSRWRSITDEECVHRRRQQLADCGCRRLR